VELLLLGAVVHWNDSKAVVDREHSAHKDGRIGTAASCGLLTCYWAC